MFLLDVWLQHVWPLDLTSQQRLGLVRAEFSVSFHCAEVEASLKGCIAFLPVESEKQLQ